MKVFSLRLTILVLLAIAVLFSGQISLAEDAHGAAAASTVYLPLISKNYAPSGSGYGNIAGTVSDIRTHSPLPNIEVCLEDTTTCMVTGLDGQYSFSHLPNGNYVVTATDPDNSYVPGSETVTVLPNQTASGDIALFPALADNDVRVVLTWDSHPTFGTNDCLGDSGGVCPNDLNLHLWIDDGNGDVQHIFIGNMGRCDDIEQDPQACYEQNEQYGGGPDVLVFRVLADIYSVGVLNYYDDRSGFPDFDDLAQRGTPARVQIFKGGSLLFDDVVTNASGDGGQEFWYVLLYDGAPQEQNCMTTYLGDTPPPENCVAKMMKKPVR